MQYKFEKKQYLYLPKKKKNHEFSLISKPEFINDNPFNHLITLQLDKDINCYFYYVQNLRITFLYLTKKIKLSYITLYYHFIVVTDKP